MAFKFVLLCATLALANAGFIEQPVAHYAPSVSYAAPVVSKTVAYSQPAAVYSQPAVYAAQPAYAAYQPAYAAKTVATYTSSPAISNYGYEHGTSEQNIIRSPHGTVSHISKAVDTPHSSVRKYDTRIVNDSPTYKVAAVAPVYQQYQQVAAPVVTKTYAQAPVATYAHQAPVYTKTYAQAPVATYAHAPVATYAQAPVATYAHAPVATYAQAPVATYAHAAPVVKQAIQYSPAVAVSHASFEGLGAHYAW